MLLALSHTAPAVADPSTTGGQPYRVPWATPEKFDDDDGTPVNNIFAPVPTPAPTATPTKPAVAPTENTESPFQNPRFKAVVSGKVYKRGAQGPDVKSIQVTLIDMGFGVPAGADGQFGGQTEDAVKCFQSSCGLETTGIIDDKTMKALDRLAPQPELKVWQDPQASALALASVPEPEGKKARILVDLSESRLTVYKADGTPEKVFPIASGAVKTPTHTGTKIVEDKLADPSALAWKLWPDSKGKAFGDRLLDLSWYDPATNTATGSDEELHGTYVRDSIGSLASHGCMRVYNEDMLWLFENLKVGDIVVVQP